MKHLIPIMVILLLVSTSFVGVGNQVEELKTDSLNIKSIECSEHSEPMFTFTGSTRVVEGREYEYTCFLEPNPCCDEYRVYVYWGSGMIVYEYPEYGTFYTGVNNTVTYRWYHWLGQWTFDVDAYAECGNESFFSKLKVHVEKHPVEYDVYGFISYNVKVTNNLEESISFDINLCAGWFDKTSLIQMDSFEVESYDTRIVKFDWPTNTIFPTTFEINSSIGESFTRRGLTLFGYNLYFPLLDKRS